MPRKLRAILMACLLALLATGKAMAASPLELVDACLDRLQQVDKQTNRSDSVTLSDSCPDLSLDLGNPQLAQLEPILEDETTLGQLSDVQRSLRSLQAIPGKQQKLSFNNLKRILDDTYTPDKKTKPSQSPINKLLDWISKKIHDYLEHDNWLTRNFHVDPNMSKSTIKGILNFSILLLVVIVLFIVVNELRAASVFNLVRRRRNKHQHPHDQLNQDRDEQPANIREIRELPVHLMIPALLSYTLQKLIDRQVLPPHYNLTNREFLGLLRQRVPAASQDFEQLVNSGERVVYGNKDVAAAEANQLLEHVHHLEKLQGKAKP